MAILSPLPVLQWIDGNGVPMAGAKLHTYEAGTVGTEKDTYTDSSGTVANPNPVVADADGRMTVWLGEGSYKIALHDALDNLIWEVDDVSGSQVLGSVDSYEELAQLEADQSPWVYVTGRLAPLDGGEGMFIWDENSTEDDDGGIIIEADSAPATGRWIRSFVDEVNVKWYGATGDSTTDDSQEFLLANTYAEANDKGLFIPTGTYYLASDPSLSVVARFANDAILKPNGYAMELSPASFVGDWSQHFDLSVSGSSVSFTNGAHSTPFLFWDRVGDITEAIQHAVNSSLNVLIPKYAYTTSDAVNVHLSNQKIKIEGSFDLTGLAKYLFKVGLNADGSTPANPVTGVIIDGLYASGDATVGSAGILVNKAKRVMVKNSIFDTIDTGIQANTFDAEDCIFEGNTFDSCLDPIYDVASNFIRATIQNNKFIDNTHAAITSYAKDVNITGNQFVDNSMADGTDRRAQIVLGRSPATSITNNAFSVDGVTTTGNVSTIETVDNAEYTGDDCVLNLSGNSFTYENTAFDYFPVHNACTKPISLSINGISITDPDSELKGILSEYTDQGSTVILNGSIPVLDKYWTNADTYDRVGGKFIVNNSADPASVFKQTTPDFYHYGTVQEMKMRGIGIAKESTINSIQGFWGNDAEDKVNAVTEINTRSGSDDTNFDDGSLEFWTRGASDPATVKRLTIDENGVKVEQNINAVGNLDVGGASDFAGVLTGVNITASMLYAKYSNIKIVTSSTYQMLSTDFVVVSGFGNNVITLPLALNDGKIVFLKNISNGITDILCSGGDTIDSVGMIQLQIAGSYMLLNYDTAKWMIISSLV